MKQLCVKDCSEPRIEWTIWGWRDTHIWKESVQDLEMHTWQWLIIIQEFIQYMEKDPCPKIQRCIYGMLWKLQDVYMWVGDKTPSGVQTSTRPFVNLLIKGYLNSKPPQSNLFWTRKNPQHSSAFSYPECSFSEMRIPVKREQNRRKHVHHYKQTKSSFPLDHKGLC